MTNLQALLLFTGLKLWLIFGYNVYLFNATKYVFWMRIGGFYISTKFVRVWKVVNASLRISLIVGF